MVIVTDGSVPYMLHTIDKIRLNNARVVKEIRDNPDSSDVNNNFAVTCKAADR